MTTQTRDLISLDSIDPMGPPKEFRIFAAGSIETTKGVFLFDEAAAAAVMQKVTEWGNDYPIDYGHSMLDGFSPADPADKNKAAGWFRPEIRNGELWATN